ncbi:MAG: F-type H+-transporting ATPase subunit gamma [Alphaproteobacteria bacterium]|jgi:F-type H+-transporting ATPase subunit gamma
MSDSMLALQRKMDSADDLRSVVRTMKSMAASSISQYEQAVLSLEDYYRTIELGLIAGLHNRHCVQLAIEGSEGKALLASSKSPIGVIIFGSDQGLVGQFNDTLLSFMVQTLKNESASTLFWPVGERMQSGLKEQKLKCTRYFPLPRTMESITSLVTEVLLEIEAQRKFSKVDDIYLFFNAPLSNTGYAPQLQKLLPLDKKWQHKLVSEHWPGKSLPELINGQQRCLISLIHEYLFVSIFKACTASLASENASRLAAMQRAEKNIEELQKNLHRTYHRKRQKAIDEELFDLVGGFEALQNRDEVK